MGDGSVVLAVRNVKKKIGGKWIIKGVSFDVRRGEVFGFLGPNGSGKTTTIRMLVGLIKPTEGTIEICGHDVQKKPTQALSHIGCIVENPELYPYLSGRENLEIFARMTPGVTEERIREVVDIVGLGQRIRDKVKTYSLGMRQRLGIAQALLGKPSLLILDEPTNGLDPLGIKEMREFIRSLADEGLSIFVSSHLLGEIEQMCDRVAIISRGTVIAVGEVDELLRQAGTMIVWDVEPADKALELFAAADHVQLIGESVGNAIAEEDGPAVGHAVVIRTARENIPSLNEALSRAGVRVYGIQAKNPTLEQLFLTMTEGENIE